MSQLGDLMTSGQEVVLDVRTQDMEINMGPQHPSTHGVLRVVITAASQPPAIRRSRQPRLLLRRSCTR